MVLPEEVFEELRPVLIGTTYQILGSWADAEDVVQATWLKWGLHHASIEHPRAWLTKVAVRASIDGLRTRQARREDYPGEWLPEPVSADPAPDEIAINRTTMSVGVLVMMESLSPLERAVFVLRHGFGWSHEEVAELLGRSQVAVRQLDHRAGRHLKERPERFAPDPKSVQEATEKFLAACVGGSIEAMLDVLAPDVALHSDGGGEAKAPPRRILGADKVARFFVAVTQTSLSEARAQLIDINGTTGLLTTIAGIPISAVSLDVDRGRISHIYLMAAPSKLTRLRFAR